MFYLIFTSQSIITPNINLLKQFNNLKMKKFYLFVLFAMIANFTNAQIEQTTYRGAFAPTPTAMWTDSWTNFDPKNEVYADATTVVNVTTDITVNTTWYTGRTYKLTGLIYVRNNATLTIQPGVVVKGVYTNTGTALVITQGAKLNAIGTAASPIVFTSAKTVAEGRQAGDWGGIILLGKAGFNINGGVNNIEGITASVNTLYGGGATPNDADNSGTLKYVRIEFPGFVFSPNNEINGLTLGAVGSGTTIDNVQVSYSGDDSFEWFGGAVNCKHLVAYRGVDDDFDTDNGYKGIVQFALGVRDPSISDNPAISTSEGFESDNNPAGAVAATGFDNTKAIFTNCTLIGPAKRALLLPATSIASGHARALRLRRATELKVINSIFLDFKNNFLFVDGTLAIANTTSGKLVFKNNLLAGISTADATLYPKGVNPTSLDTWMENGLNVSQSSSDNVLTMPYDATTNTFSGLDYRPGTAASTGASFTDASISPFVIASATGSTPVVTNRTYCKGDVATVLTAALTTTGVSLKWYTVATLGTALLTAPTPSTSMAGVKNYYVSQVNSSNVESARVLLTVTTNALPTEVVSTITGQGPLVTAEGVDPVLNPAVYASAVAVGKYVGTTSAFTYSITAFADTTLTYLWSVPSGVNIVSGQGTYAITVNYLNVPFGAGAVGSVSVQAVNSGGCKTVAKTLAITKALPTAPATLVMTDGVSATAITSFAKYMGLTTPLTLTAGYVDTAFQYQWELPTGVNLVLPTGVVPVTTVSNYSAEPFLSVASVPGTVGTKYWALTENAYTFDVNGVSTTTKISTVAQKIVGSTKTYTFTITANAANANAVNTLFTYNGNTYKLTTATTSSSTSAICTYSSAFPGTFPTALSTTVNGTLTPVSTGAAISFGKIAVSGYDATTSQAYAPYGTKVKTNSKSIAINFSGVTNAATTKLYLGVKSLNSVGESATSNVTNADVAANNQIPGLFRTTYTETFVAPNATTLANATSVYNATGTAPSTAKLLTLTAAIPLAPAAIKMTNDAVSTVTAVTVISKFIGTSTVFTLTATASTNTASYLWEIPAGVNQLSGGTSNVITVNFAGVAAGTTALYIGVKAVNGIGNSVTVNASTLVPATTSTAKLLKLTATVPAAVTVVTGQILGVCNGSTKSYTITASELANRYVITAPAGSVVTSSSNASNTSNVLATTDLVFDVLYPANLSTLTPKTIVITSVNGVGNSLTNKTLTLTTTGCTGKMSEKVDVIDLTNETKLFPNPTSGELNISINAVKAGSVDVEIYSVNGLIVKTIKSMNLQEGSNTAIENISSLQNGIYFVKFYNSANNEIIVRKLVKN